MTSYLYTIHVYRHMQCILHFIVLSIGSVTEQRIIQLSTNPINPWNYIGQVSHLPITGLVVICLAAYWPLDRGGGL